MTRLADMTPSDIANTTPKAPDEREKLEREVGERIDNIMNAPRPSNIPFDSYRGHVTPADEYKTDTSAGLKEIIKALERGDASDAQYSDVERLIYKYQIFVLQGIREDVAKHKGVSWYLVDKPSEQRALISYQDGPHGEWVNECYADEMPLWLLMSLLRRIARRKPLGDQDADDTIAHVDRLDTEYEGIKDKRATERGGLDVITYSSYLRKRGNDGD